jgi:hypothetical protein
LGVRLQIISRLGVIALSHDFFCVLAHGDFNVHRFEQMGWADKYAKRQPSGLRHERARMDSAADAF